MWYRIGKDFGVRGMLLAKVKRKHPFLLPITIRYLATVFKSAGGTVCEDVIYDTHNQSLILRGKDNIIWRKIKDGSFFAGVISGMMTILTGKNMEGQATSYDNDQNYSEIKVNYVNSKKYIQDLEGLSPLKDKYRLNFLHLEKNYNNLCSFSDLFRFKRSGIDSTGKFFFNKKTIIPFEIGIFGLITHHYSLIGEKRLMEKGLSKGVQDVSKHILENEITQEQKLRAIMTMICAFGGGIPIYTKTKKNFVLKIIFPPITRYGFFFENTLIKEYLSCIFECDVKIKRESFDVHKQVLNVHYQFK